LTPADEFCPRTISFTIPGGSPGNPGVQVTAVEHQENGVKTGTIDFTVDVLGDADLRGLFFQFNEAHLNGLKVTGGDGLITNTLIQANSVINLGQGAEMNGAASPFDVGIRWGTPGPNPDNINFPVHFTLSNAANNLTLDDVAHQEFGAKVGAAGGKDAKLTTIAPAAPDAHDDAFKIFEDGASGLGDPSHVPVGQLFEVIKNSDTDADGDTLTVTGFHDGPSHGTVQIVDGADADALPGDAVLYTPDADYSGPDSFVYCVSDGHGGQDNATVNVTVEAVADIPDLQVSVALGATINEYIVNVTATQTDLDSSEFIDRISWSGVPADVTITPVGDPNPAGEPGQLAMQFVVTVPLGQDTKFDLDITDVSKEVSNGDEEQATFVQPIELDFTHNQTQKDFLADHQSIWSTGNAFSVDEHPFVGPNISFDESAPFPIPAPPFVLEAFAKGHFKTGLQVDIHLEGGAIDAHLPFDITVDTTYNKTTDDLLIQTGAELAPGATFTTTGPEGNVSLKFILDFLAEVGIEDPLGFGIGLSKTLSLQPDPIDLLPIPVSSTSPDLPFTVPLPAGLSISFDWPHLSVHQEDQSGNTVSGDGASNNFIQLNADVDFAVAQLFPLFAPIEAVLDPDPLDPNNFEILDLDVNGGANFLQKFVLNSLGLDGTLTFENGHQETFQQNIPIIHNASTLDGPDAGSAIDFSLSLTPDVTLENTTSIGFGQLGLLKNIPVIDETLFNKGITIPIASIPLDTTNPFDLHFNNQSYDLFV